MTSREQFEAWMFERGQLCERGTTSEYASIGANIAWIAWQASRAELVVELPNSHPMDNHLVRLDEVVEALEAAGVRVEQ